ncbi:PTS sugar transporter subunit IIA [Nocardioides sp. CGMCC 1.13656]|uniref:PTS sugar transporter subunit IIA n=1 Tax=Nocardioides TaxID=1839 RepID=UPI0012FBDD90|nr:PTS sugar transporter subunit IIA [Nocardioides sp. CGMCC 1.13656]MBA2955501.1 PTS sugar transporter subunit IIA [Nocardioides sp. CGMCC 1.13656]
MNAAPSPAVAPEIAVVNEDLGTDATSVVRALVARLHAAGRVTDEEALVEAVLARESVGSTALPGGIAIPHARSAAVTTPSVAAALLAEAISWPGGSDPVRLVLLIAAPGDDPQSYLGLLQKVAAACVKTAFVGDVAAASTPTQLADVLAAGAHLR